MFSTLVRGNNNMNENIKPNFWVIISFVLNMLFGSSFILGYMQYKNQVENLNRDMSMKERINQIEVVRLKAQAEDIKKEMMLKEQIANNETARLKAQAKALEAEEMKYKAEVDKETAQKLDIIGNLHDKIETKLYNIIVLNREYLVEIELNKKDPTTDRENRINQIKQQLELLNNDLINLEKQLASLERRPARNINTDFIPPAAPKIEVKIVP
jgi:hypothetical protein